VIPLFFPKFKSMVEVIFLNAVEHLWMSDTASKHHPFSFIFNLENKVKSQGAKLRVGRMGNDNHVAVSHKLCGFQGRVGGHIVVMKEPVVVAPSSGLFHCTFPLKCLKMSQ
jgi:hypothetical protein